MQPINFKNRKDIKNFIKQHLPSRLEKYVKQIKGIHNLLNKLIIVSDKYNGDHLRHDIPQADKMAWDQSEYISINNLIYELIGVKLNKDLSPVLAFEAEYIKTELIDDCKQDHEEYFYIEIHLKNEKWTVKKIND
jgi:hypothetical protein